MQGTNDDQPNPVSSVADYVEQSFGQAVKQRREELGWSQRELAERLSRLQIKLDPSAVTRIERGQRSVRLGEAWMIAKELQIPLAYLMARRTSEGLRNELARLENMRERARTAIAEYERDMATVHEQIRKLEQDELEDRYYGDAGED